MIRIIYLKTMVEVQHGSLQVEQPIAETHICPRSSVQWGESNCRHCAWAELVTAIRDAEVSGVECGAVLLERAEVATVQGGGWHLSIAGAGTVLGHSRLDGSIHLLVRREASPGKTNLAELMQLRVGRSCIFAGSDQGRGLLEQADCWRSRMRWCRTSWLRSCKGQAARLEDRLPHWLEDCLLYWSRGGDRRWRYKGRRE